MLLISALVFLASFTFSALSVRADADEEAAPTSGTTSIDVWAQGDILDLVTAVQRGASKAAEHRRSMDGGATWSDPVAVPLVPTGLARPHRGNDLQIAAAGQTIVVLYETKGTSRWGGGPMATARSVDGGRTWTVGPNPADDGSTDGHAFLALATEASGRFHGLWLDNRGGAQGLRATRSGDGGKTWEKNVTVDAKTCECCWNEAAALDGKTVTVLYRDLDPRDMAMAASADGGATWTRLATVGGFGWAFDGCPHVGGGLARSESGGKARVHATVWTGKSEDLGAYWLASDDGGHTWPHSRRLGSALSRATDIAASGQSVATVWDESGGGRSAIHGSLSLDGGATWGPPRLLSSPKTNASHPRVVATTGGFLVLWTEGRDGGMEWRQARLDVGATTNSAPSR